LASVVVVAARKWGDVLEIDSASDSLKSLGEKPAREKKREWMETKIYNLGLRQVNGTTRREKRKALTDKGKAAFNDRSSQKTSERIGVGVDPEWSRPESCPKTPVWKFEKDFGGMSFLSFLGDLGLKTS